MSHILAKNRKGMGLLLQHINDVGVSRAALEDRYDTFGGFYLNYLASGARQTRRRDWQATPAYGTKAKPPHRR